MASTVGVDIMYLYVSQINHYCIVSYCTHVVFLQTLADLVGLQYEHAQSVHRGRLPAGATT